MMRRGFRGSLLLAGILTLWAASASAQAIGSIFGKVTDDSGAVLPGVTVTVAGPSLQQPLVAVTTGTGAFQFPNVPIGKFTVTFEMSGFKKVTRPDVVIESGFNAGIDAKLELGALTEEVTVSGASPIVDLKRTTTGSVFTADVLEKIPSARDPWQIIGMTPGVRAGLNVGGSTSGQQVGLNSRGTAAHVQWNLEGGSITDLSSNSSPAYFNFDSLEQIQVSNGGGDVSVQSSGLAINLVTKSGSNVFKGTAMATFSNDSMQSSNVTPELFSAGANGFLSGAPIQKIAVYSVEYGGPIKKDKLWFWASTDYQDINVGVVNFFDASKSQFCSDLVAAQKARNLAGSITYDNLDQVSGCLNNDKTTIKNLLWKINYQLNSANKVQYLFQSDNKYRNRRDASATNLEEVTSQQTSDAPWNLPLPTHSITHTMIASDKLVFNNMFTYVGGGFFLDYQDVPPQGDCLQSRYLGTDTAASYQTGGRELSGNCQWNIQSLTNRTTGFNSRAKTSTYQTVRKSWEVKTDGTYLLSGVLGGDHSLKFGMGWRKNPIMSFSHYSGGARAHQQCVGNNNANCGNGETVAVGSAAGFVPYQAVLYRDQLRNNNWWTYNGYIQDSFSTGRWRFNGGVRYDWQYSTYLGGCVPENVIMPTLLPAQCEDATEVDTITGKKLQSFSNWSPRLSATYDLFGRGKTVVKATWSYFYDTRITLANSLGGLFEQPALTWGPNQSSGACSTTAGAPCWTDANRDGLVQSNELIGNPTTTNARFQNGVLQPAGNNVDPSAELGRTREAIVGMQHELISNLAVGVDYIYRKYDKGTATYTQGYQPGAPGFPLSQIYSGPRTFTDPVTGLSAPYYEICQGCARPSGVGSIVMTDFDYEIYHGVDITATKRFSDGWQMQAALTLQTNPNYLPEGSVALINPTTRPFRDGVSSIEPWIFKLQGSYTFPWDIIASGNLNMYDGATRTLTINGPGSVYGGVNALTGAATTISYTTLEFQDRNAYRFDPIKLLDLGAQKVFQFNGGRQRIKLILDAFNVFNINTITAFASGNISTAGGTQPSTIVSPRVFRVGTQLVF
jgi:hypothetical protein